MMDQAIELMYEILRLNLKRIINIKETPLKIDVNFATDLMLFTVNTDTIAVRMRRSNICKGFRDLTIQTQQASGNRHNTEYIKIFEKGYVRWYLYCWVKNEKIHEWMFIDLDILRSTKLIERYQEKTNKNDGQLFKAIPYKVMLKQGCIVDSNLNPKKLRKKTFLRESQLSLGKNQIRLSDFF